MSDTPPSVLVVDDSISMRAVITTIVKKMGYTVCGEAANGKDAVAMTLKLLPNMVMLDINMPVKTGIEALTEIKALQPDVVVIMMTSVSDTESVEKCIEAGAASYILKSASHDEIAQSVREAWEQASGY